MIQDTQDWANFIFGNCKLGDKRRTDRLVSLACGLANHVGKSVVKSSSDSASIEGNYRLVRNKHVTAEAVPAIKEYN